VSTESRTSQRLIVRGDESECKSTTPLKSRQKGIILPRFSRFQDPGFSRRGSSVEEASTAWLTGRIAESQVNCWGWPSGQSVVQAGFELVHPVGAGSLALVSAQVEELDQRHGPY
jgi:hypothetical protein